MSTLSGPFSDAAAAPVRARAPRDWENGESFGDGWGANAPINVGKRGRNRNRARMEQRALELEEREQDDPGDWFSNPRNVRNRGVRGAGGEGGGGPDAAVGKKKDAKIRIGRAWKSDDPPPPPPSGTGTTTKLSLLERVSNDDEYDPHSSRGHRHGYYGRDRDRDRDRDRYHHGRDRDRDRDRGGGRDHHDRDWDRDRDHDGGRDEVGFRIRGSAGRTDPSRHRDSEMGERKGRRREESGTRSRDRERESRASRDHGPRSPQYKGGYTR